MKRACGFLVLLWCALWVTCNTANVNQPSRAQLEEAVGRARQALQPKVPHRQISRALYPGDSERLRRVLLKMYAGSNIKVVALGGSITFGMGVFDGGTMWVRRLHDWFTATFLNGNVEVINGAIPGINSGYMSSCADAYAPQDTDLVIVELCANDMGAFTIGIDSDIRKAFERLVRKLLSHPKQPAVLLLNSYQLLNLNQPEQRHHKYLENAEAFYFDIATYYGLPMASMKAASYHLMMKSVDGYWGNGTQYTLPEGDPTLHKYMYWDTMHPSGTTGHTLLFELIANLLLQASHSLLALPWQPDEEALVSTALPAPVFEDNYEGAHALCLLGDVLKTSAQEMHGFSWLNEAKTGMHPKWGYTALEAGSTIRFVVSTLELLGSHIHGGSVTVQLAFLRSYEHMGIAQITCSGCTCSPSQFDGHRSDSTTSQLEMHTFQVSRHAECGITVTVLPETHSGEHKVKIGGVVIGEVGLGNLADKVDLKVNLVDDGTQHSS